MNRKKSTLTQLNKPNQLINQIKKPKPQTTKTQGTSSIRSELEEAVNIWSLDFLVPGVYVQLRGHYFSVPIHIL